MEGNHHMSLKRTTRNFFGTEILGDSHSSNFAGNIVSNGSNHPPPIGSVAFDIRSVLPDQSVGTLHPIVVSSLQPFIGSIASDIRSVIGADFGCARPV